MSLMNRYEEDGSDSGKSLGSSGSSLTLHTSRLLHTTLSPSLLILSFFPEVKSTEIDEDDKEDEGKQCHSSIEL